VRREHDLDRQREQQPQSFDDLLARVLHAADLESKDGDFQVARALARRYRMQVLQGPEGEAQAPGMAARVIERLEAGDRSGAAREMGEPVTLLYTPTAS